MKKLVVPVVAGLGLVAAIVFLSDRNSQLNQTIDTRALASLRSDLGLRIGDGDSARLERIAVAVESLSNIVEEEIAERRIQAEQLDALQKQLADLEDNLGERVTQAFNERREASADDVNNTGRRQRTVAADSTASRLAAVGFSQQQIDSFREIQANTQLRQIEFDDRARREGWDNTPRYYQELRQFANGMDDVRAQIGDDDFDRYLYAIGQANRITVTSVLANSQAQRAGVQAGDVVVSYGARRVFSTHELTELRSQGRSGDPVDVQIIRNGVPMQLTMPRGPIGIYTDEQMMDPTAPPNR